MSGGEQKLTWELLEKWTGDKLQKMVGCQPDDIVQHVFSLESVRDIENYLSDLLGNTRQSKQFVETFLKKMNSLPKRTKKKQSLAHTIQVKQGQQGQGQGQKGNKQKVKISSFSEIQIDGTIGDTCECQATKHKLIGNCLNCGKVICEHEGNGPCKFCGTALNSKIDHSKPIVMSDKETAAIQYKDRILGYQKHGVQRTIVYDDQEDYFSNANNKWISADERKTIQLQEQEYNDKMEKEKKTIRIQLDFVNGRILPATTPIAPPKIEKLNLTNQSNIEKNNNSNQNSVESLKLKDGDQVVKNMHYVTEHRRHIPKSKQQQQPKGGVQSKQSSVVQQYYGIEDDGFILNNNQENENQFKFKGIIEGLWFNNFHQQQQQQNNQNNQPNQLNQINCKLPNSNIYNNYLKTLGEKNNNYFIIGPDQYHQDTVFSLTSTVPKSTLEFVKSLVDQSTKFKVMINVALQIPMDFVFSASDSVSTLKKRIESYCSVGVSQFTLVLPYGFNDTFTTIPTSVQCADYNTAKTYASCQVTTINQVLQELSGKVKDMLVCPSYFQVDLAKAPTRQHIEYWRELIRGLDTRCTLAISTPSGRCDNYILSKLSNLFDKRQIVIIEKFPYRSRVDKNTVLLDAYQPLFSDNDRRLAGVLATPYNHSFLLDRLDLLIPLTTFSQYLHSPHSYQDELTMRANLAEMMMNDSLAEDFADVIISLSNGVLDTMLLDISTSIDDRGRVFISNLVQKAQNVLTFFSSSSLELSKSIQNIINILLLSSYPNYVQSQLDQAELDSAIWVIKQYKLDVPLDQNLCDGVTFYCIGNHVFEINIKYPAFSIDHGPPDTTVLTFPELYSFSVERSADPSQVALPEHDIIVDLITCCPKLGIVNFTDDPTVQSLGASFSLLPETLLYASFIMSGAQTITLQSHANMTQLTIFGSESLTDFIIPSTVSMPEMTILNFGVRPTSPGSMPLLQTVGNLTVPSFPKLYSLKLNFPPQTSPLQLYFDVPVMGLLEFTAPTFATVNFINSIFSLIILKYIGGGITFIPSLGEINTLLSITATDYNPIVQDTYPFVKFPSILVLAEFSTGTLNTVPNVTVPPSLVKLDLNSNQIQGDMDFDNILKNTTGALELILSNNTQLSGPLDHEVALCRLKRLYLDLTAVTTVPACFWCYFDQNVLTIPAAVSQPSGFSCVLSVDNTTIYTVFQRGIVTGSSLGWGSNVGGITVTPIIPNEKMEVYIPTVPSSGAPQPYTVQFSDTQSTYTIQFNVVEVGFIPATTSLSQYPNQTALLAVTFSSVNSYFAHYAQLNGTSSTNSNPIANGYSFQIPISQPSLYTPMVYNDHYNYPKVSQLTVGQGGVAGSTINIIGNFGPFQDSINIVVFNNGTQSQSNYSPCTPTLFASGTIKCVLDQSIAPGLVTFNITVDGYLVQHQVTLESLQQECEIETNHCHGNGQCSIFGDCICNINQGSYYNDCLYPYPFITSGVVNDADGEQKSISLYGDFGPLEEYTNATVTFNNTISCIVAIGSSGHYNLDCLLDESPTSFGYVSVQLNLDGLLYKSDRVFQFIDPSSPGGSTSTATTSGSSSSSTATPTSSPTSSSSTGVTTNTATTTTTGSSSPTSSSSTSGGGGGGGTPKELCQKRTQNCYGHGECDDNGVCQCEEKYNPVDHCATKFVDNSTFTPNTTSPSSKIEVDGVEFEFEIIAIQEIGIDNDEIVKELFTVDWLSNISKPNSTMINAAYELVISNTSRLADTKVNVNITFSTLPRTVVFGDQQLITNPNSIKMSVSITDWRFSTNIGTLRLVLKTTINNQQSMKYDCKETNVDSFDYDDIGDVQYLRVIKDGVQFNGRFIDFALANGRSTYSKTFVINQTEIIDSGDQSVAMIECILDPDFTPLLVVNDKNDDCDGSSNTWKIIVGVVIGGIALIAIIIGAVMYTRKRMEFKKHNKIMQAKLRALAQLGVLRIFALIAIRELGLISTNDVDDVITVLLSIAKDTFVLFTCRGGDVGRQPKLQQLKSMHINKSKKYIHFVCNEKFRVFANLTNSFS
ncbi:hypothetical protein DFA_00171 [Cavenderia fasciculata]|uniref:GH84 domain-containing protein n=1 Tax=Cavenderia fasciculata TaxID=261658 RepID=F4PXT3_CACFS|nr:uncharacterized protein DFA_00171 [Cavenderia fasciculata]EGG19593.1 hypothetical protein DFA_00171 [Cavenderia fasciculata]|eukprot:XP_004357887.1 hypothetical protein DFA_00171 [Cavenderia fasciculata]